MTLNITTAPVPTQATNRTSEPNPFDGRFPTPEGEALVVVMPSATEDEKKAVKRVITLAQAAAKAEGLTCRKRTEDATEEVPESGKGKDKVAAHKVEQTRVFLWSVAAIKRPRKTAEGADNNGQGANAEGTEGNTADPAENGPQGENTAAEDNGSESGDVNKDGTA